LSSFFPCNITSLFEQFEEDMTLPGGRFR
jgi:hypothetical protein